MGVVTNRECLGALVPIHGRVRRAEVYAEGRAQKMLYVERLQSPGIKVGIALALRMMIPTQSHQIDNSIVLRRLSIT
jgi:hypothetical protein